MVTSITIIYFAATTHNFLSGSTFTNTLPYFAPYAIIAAGQVFVMTLGEIDLSIGAMYLFTPFLYYKLNQAGLPIVPFVATLGMLFVLDGVTLVISHSEQVTTPGTSVTGTTTFSQIFGAGTYSELIWAIVIVIALQVLLSFTRWGIYTVAAGGNRLGAAEAGINTRLVLVRNFMLCALTAGFVGVLEAVRSSSASPDPSGSNAILLQAIAAVIIGGTLMTGGAGTVIGALIGALFLGILNDGLVLKGVNGNYVDLYLGIAILIAMTVNVYVQRVRTGSGRA